MSPIATKPNFEKLLADCFEGREACFPPEYRLPKSAFPLPKNVSTTIPNSGILDDAELAILELTAIQLRDAIAARKYTAVAVATAYCKSATIAQQLTNCLVGLLRDEAIERAKWLDEQLEQTGKVVGPFHGLPVSIKDHINVKGVDSPSGFLALVGNMVAKEDAHLVTILRDAGAVFYAKTMNPQSLMHLETQCVLGPTTCPYNTDLTAGGSTGGEGALLALKGSPLGIGTDIGGSVRSPAACCGVYAFKPSAGRLPLGGCNMPIGPPGYEAILCTHGPMARSAEDLGLYMELVADSKPWLKDPSPWRQVEAPKKLRVGVLRTDGVVEPVQPIKRVLNYALEKLGQSAEFELVDYQPLDGRVAWEIISKLYWPDKGKMIRDYCKMSGEPVLPLTEWILSHAADNDGTLEEFQGLVARRDEFRRAMSAHWQASGIDVIISPVAPTPACKVGTTKYWNYTSFWNLVNYPAAVFPTGLSVDPSIDNEVYKPHQGNTAEEWIGETYSPEGNKDAPLCLQLIGYVGHDEETLAALNKVVACLKA